MSVLYNASNTIFKSKGRNILIGILLLTIILIPLAGCAEKKESDPASFNYSDGLDDKGFWKGVKALKYVELVDYDAIPIPKEVHKITEEQVQAEVDEIQKSVATSTQITDRAVVDGDKVNIDYVGSVDGVEFENGSTGGTGAEVEIGVTTYIDDFLQQLIGHSPGETFDINVTFPEDYATTDLAGKDAVFVTTVNYIVETTLPELTDEFIAENLQKEFGWTTLSEMKAAISAQQQKEAISAYISDYLNKEVKVTSIPNTLIEYQKNSLSKYYLDGAASYGMEIDEFLSTFVGVASLDELLTTAAEDNEKTAKNYLIIQAIAEDAKISVSDDELGPFFLEQTGSEDYSQYEEFYGKPFIKRTVLESKVLDYLIEHAKLK